MPLTFSLAILPYFLSDIVFDERNVTKVLGEAQFKTDKKRDEKKSIPFLSLKKIIFIFCQQHQAWLL
jgi:hypothetical protein